MIKTMLNSIVLKHMKNKLINSIIKEEDITEVLKQIRIALLDADVNLLVVKNFIKNIRAKAIGTQIDKNQDPEKIILKIIKDELINILGQKLSLINTESFPTKIMLIGLQGSGKTTTAAKLSNYLKNKNNLKPLLVALDIYRPGAIDQLKELAIKNNIDFFEKGTQNPIKTAEQALEFAKNNKNNLIIFDTAGRLQTDEKLMNELYLLKNTTQPTDILLTVDSMSGQEMVNIASEFNEKLKISGVIVTKLDSDAKAGIILSITSLLNVPIKMTGTGEKISDLDLFYPERMADRILGLGDIMTLAEKAADVIDENKSKKSMIRMLSGKMDLEDLVVQFEQINKVGSLNSIMKMIPGTQKIDENKIDEMENKIKTWKILMSSMTLKERRNPGLFRKSINRRIRVIKGSGCKPDDLNKLLNEFDKIKKKMDQISGSLKKGKNPLNSLNEMF